MPKLAMLAAVLWAVACTPVVSAKPIAVDLQVKSALVSYGKFPNEASYGTKSVTFTLTGDSTNLSRQPSGELRLPVFTKVEVPDIGTFQHADFYLSIPPSGAIGCPYGNCLALVFHQSSSGEPGNFVSVNGPALAGYAFDRSIAAASLDGHTANTGLPPYIAASFSEPDGNIVGLRSGNGLTDPAVLVSISVVSPGEPIPALSNLALAVLMLAVLGFSFLGHWKVRSRK